MKKGYASTDPNVVAFFEAKEAFGPATFDEFADGALPEDLEGMKKLIPPDVKMIWNSTEGGLNSLVDYTENWREIKNMESNGELWVLYETPCGRLAVELTASDMGMTTIGIEP